MDETKDAGRTFGVDLWDGFPKVHAYIHDGRSEMKRLQTFFSERAFAEAQYAKNLQKSCENLLAEKFIFGGTTGAAIMKLEKCNRLAITKHSELARRMNTHADKTLKQLIENLKHKCNDMKKAHDKMSDRVSSKDSSMRKAQKNYHSNNESCINQVSNRNTLMANNAPQPKLDKAEKKLKSAASKLASSEKSYKDSVDNLKKQQIERDGSERKLLEQSEGLARNRMAEVQTALALWKDIFDDMARHNADLSAQLEAAINSIDVNNDVQEFIAKSYSGQDINKSHVVYQPLEKIDMSCFADRFMKASTPTARSTPSTLGSGPAISGPMNTGGGLGSNASSMAPLSAASTSVGRSESSASHSGTGGSPLSGPAGSNGAVMAGGASMGRGAPPMGRGGGAMGRGGHMPPPMGGRGGAPASMANSSSHTPRPPPGGPSSSSAAAGGASGPGPAANSATPPPSGAAGPDGAHNSPPMVSAPTPPVSEERKYVRALYDTTVEEEGQPGSNTDNEMQPNELRFVAGDIILFHEDLGNGWWRGELRDGNEGIMPANYVEIIESPNIPNPTWDDIMRIAQRFCKAIFAFQGNRDDGELSFDIGDEIEIISEIEEWYNGRTKDGQTGLFPQTYVNLVTSEDRQS